MPRSFPARLLLVQSNGGVCTAEVAAAQPVRLLLSGPSGGFRVSVDGREIGTYAGATIVSLPVGPAPRARVRIDQLARPSGRASPNWLSSGRAIRRCR